MQQQILTLGLLGKGKVKDEVAEVLLVHQLEVLAQIEPCQVSIRLAHEVELIAGDQLKVVHLHKESIVLDALHADHHEVVFASIDDL